MTDNAVSSQQIELSEEQIIDYLRAHPNFFVDHDYLLRELKVIHRNGSAISLGERQVQVFREHRDELKNQLEDLIEIARDNDAHFDKSRRLLLSLLEIKSIDEIELVVKEAFKDDENIDFSSVVIFGDQTDYPASEISLISYEQAKEKLGNLVDSTSAICGRFTDQQMACLFPADADSIGSAAVIPLNNGETIGMFCLGSKDSNHFDSGMGSLFLSYISDFISRMMPELLLKSRSQKVAEHIPSLLE